MVLLADVGGISGVVGTLTGMQVPAGAIAKIVAIIEEQQASIDRDNLLYEVKPAWFGRSQSGTVLGTHSGKAHATLSNAILEAVAGLQGTTAAMTDFEEVLTKKDEDRAAAATTLVAQTEAAVGQMDGDLRTPPNTSPASHGKDGD